VNFFLAGMAIVVFAFHIAWIGKRAEARGRNVLGWVSLGLVLCLVGVRLGMLLFVHAERVDSDLLSFFYVTSPVWFGIAPLIGIVLVLLALPTRATIGKAWPVFEKVAGPGKLVIEDDAIELRWEQRTERIARAGLVAEADVETIRLRWRDGTGERELAILPTGKPANREGRMRQAEAIAARLRA
jgi:hypothetical protein